MFKFQERLKLLRKDNHLTQKELGLLVGVKQNTYTNWERGTREPDLLTVIKFSEIFNVSTDYLLGVSDEK
ncbi:helix-turn-helix transcriptional regulator [Streptococcus parauberis]|uniref:helix-turn-helix domain-containing protein n=1 Tax=Streptococcus parauberis TaxID=1348 RepID=UPI002890A27E|nr:helix-turn-helix transcriptional regulator [Streptococcus parauberis]MDT2749604.1 helix-turn-helix transcriptional regulator [Streptococcus parauberis]